MMEQSNVEVFEPMSAEEADVISVNSRGDLPGGTL